MAGMDPPIPISSPGRLIVVQHILEEAMKFYAMRALPDFEIEPLEEHLLMCPECRDRFMGGGGAAAAASCTTPTPPEQTAPVAQ
jgi:predicted anti-sigma-YlaC factor YlaD